MSDLIRRQAANVANIISLLSEMRSQYNCFDEAEQPYYHALSEAIKALSAQPDLDEWCVDCKEYDSKRHCCPRWNRVIKQTVAELKESQLDIIRCKDCKHYYFADNRIPQEQRFNCDLDGDRWSPDSYCSFGERREE